MINRGLMLRAGVCLCLGWLLTATSPDAARAAEMSCPNITYCGPTCYWAEYLCQSESNANCTYNSWMCGSGGGACGGEPTVICSGYAT